jgi:hypothetical protein
MNNMKMSLSPIQLLYNFITNEILKNYFLVEYDDYSNLDLRDDSFSISFMHENIEYTINVIEKEDIEIQYYISYINIENYDINEVLYDKLDEYEISIDTNNIFDKKFWTDLLINLLIKGKELEEKLTKITNDITNLKSKYGADFEWFNKLIEQD